MSNAQKLEFPEILMTTHLVLTVLNRANGLAQQKVANTTRWRTAPISEVSLIDTSITDLSVQLSEICGFQPLPTPQQKSMFQAPEQVLVHKVDSSDS